MYDASLVKGCLYPVDWLTELTNGEKGVWMTLDHVYGFALEVEVSGVYEGYDDEKPSANSVRVWLYSRGLEDTADYSFRKEYKSPEEALELGKALHDLFSADKGREDIISFCKQQHLACDTGKV